MQITPEQRQALCRIRRMVRTPEFWEKFAKKLDDSRKKDCAEGRHRLEPSQFVGNDTHSRCMYCGKMIINKGGNSPYNI